MPAAAHRQVTVPVLPAAGKPVRQPSPLDPGRGAAHPAAKPELPEVETTRRGIEQHLRGRRIRTAIARVPACVADPPAWTCSGRTGGGRCPRRAKYLLVLERAACCCIWASGSLRVLPAGLAAGRHDHFDLVLADGRMLRLTDPRRFGAVLWQPPGQVHPRLQGLGPEPLSDDFSGDGLWRQSRGRRAPVKTFIMDQRVVVGVGNIYAAEALFAAGIHPLRAAGRISRQRWQALAVAIRTVLAEAIGRGGTTLRDFLSPDGAPGYFEQELQVYGRQGQPSRRCGAELRLLRLGGRASSYCPRCQR